MSGRITHLFGRINHVSDRLGWALSHLTWLAGLFVLADLVTRQQWVTNVEQFPVLSTALFALLLTTSGLEAVLYKWKYRRAQAGARKDSG
jgi:hypothetical protein